MRRETMPTLSASLRMQALGSAEFADRIPASARLVTATRSSDPDTAPDNLQREPGDVGAIASKIEWLPADLDCLNVTETSHAC